MPRGFILLSDTCLLMNLRTRGIVRIRRPWNRQWFDEDSLKKMALKANKAYIFRGGSVQTPVFGPNGQLSTYSHCPQRKKKEPKKKETAAATLSILSVQPDGGTSSATSTSRSRSNKWAVHEPIEKLSVCASSFLA